jgi:hypothetical protein
MKRNVVVLVGLCFALFAGVVGAQTPEKYQFVSPRPGARLVPPGTTITIRPGGLINKQSVSSALFSVVGERSGAHSGSVAVADDQQTIIFKPQNPFALGERVRVTVRRGIANVSGRVFNDFGFDFTIAPQVRPAPDVVTMLGDEISRLPQQIQPAAPARRVPHFVTVPSDFPVMTMTVPVSNTGDGYIFIAPINFGSGTTPYLLILDNTASPVYYKRLDANAFDFKKQPNGLLTYYKSGVYLAMDSSYNIVDTYQAGNGYSTDLHELQLLPNGHALLMIYDPQIVDMSQIAPGGYTTATVIGLVIQELDTLKNVVFQWRSWDHMLITDTQVSLTTPRVDYVHGNAIEQDTDGNLMISSRHLSEITKINRQTGDIIWRWGGNRNEFTFVNDTPYFRYQHDIRRLPNGNVTIFDNRNGILPAYSRGVEYQLDEVNKTATKVWEFYNTPPTISGAMGNAQRLPNGNTVIGWGTAALMTEVHSDGTKAFELALAPRMNYRAFRFPWTGNPTWAPTLVLDCQGLTKTLTYSWNGATDVASYRVYGGHSPNPTTLITTQPRTGFETQTVLASPASLYSYFRVMPVNNQGQDTQYSNEVFCSTTLLPVIAK